MDMKNIRAGYTKMLESLEKGGVKLDESQKEAFDGFMVAIESKYRDVRDSAIKATRRIVAESMNKKFQSAFESYQKHLFENITLTRMIQEKVDAVRNANLKAEIDANAMKKLEESVDNFLDGWIEEVLPKKSILDYNELKESKKLVESLRKEVEAAKTATKVDESLEKEIETLKTALSEAKSEREKAKGRVLLENKLEDVPPLEAKEMRKKLDGCTECDVSKNFEKALKEVRDGMETQNPAENPEEGVPAPLESEIASILEVEEEGKQDDGGNVSAMADQGALPQDDPEGIDEDGDEVYETEVDLYESSGELDTIDQKAMDYFIATLENSYRFAR